MRLARGALAGLLALALAGCTVPGQQGGTTSASGGSSRAEVNAAGPGHDHRGIPDCEADELPDEAAEVIEAIETGGPVDHPGKDGATFGNRERLLPGQRRGFYREYTVRTPGERDRGARRIVTGGDDRTEPEHWYYTADHYDSFCEFTPAA